MGCGVTTPIISQWPVVVSLPRERSTSRPATAGAPGCAGQRSRGTRHEIGSPEAPTGALFGDIVGFVGGGRRPTQLRAGVRVLVKREPVVGRRRAASSRGRGPRRPPRR